MIDLNVCLGSSHLHIVSKWSHGRFGGVWSWVGNLVVFVDVGAEEEVTLADVFTVFHRCNLAQVGLA